jgi:hypothetical protein
MADDDFKPEFSEDGCGLCAPLRIPAATGFGDLIPGKVQVRTLLRGWRRKLACLLLVLKPGSFVRAVAKGFGRRVSATAQSDCRSSAKTIGAALHVDEFTFPFDTQWTVISYRDLSWRHSSSFRRAAIRRRAHNLRPRIIS